MLLLRRPPAGVLTRRTVPRGQADQIDPGRLADRRNRCAVRRVDQLRRRSRTRFCFRLRSRLGLGLRNRLQLRLDDRLVLLIGFGCGGFRLYCARLNWSSLGRGVRRHVAGGRSGTRNAARRRRSIRNRSTTARRTGTQIRTARRVIGHVRSVIGHIGSVIGHVRNRRRAGIRRSSPHRSSRIVRSSREWATHPWRRTVRMLDR